MSRFFFALFFLVVSHVHAETIPATGNGVTTPVLKYVYSSKIYSTGAAVCAAMNAANSNYYAYTWGTNTSYPNGYCIATNHAPFPGWGTSPPQANRCDGPDGSAETFAPCSQIYSCPSGQNWTLSGTTCTRPDCAAGETRGSDGVCLAACQNGYTRSPSTGQCVYNCSSVQGWVNGQCVDCAGRSDGGFSGAYSWANSPGSPAPSGGCGSNFCYYPTVAKVQQGTKNVFQFSSTSNGQSCTPGADAGTPATSNVQTPTANTPEGCLAQGKGYVTGSSGTTSCVGAADAPTSAPVKTTSTDSKKTTDTAGTTTTETTETTTECSGGNCTTTKATTNGAGTTTTQESETSDSYCLKNPNAAMCKQQDDPCKDHPERIGCSEFGDPVEGEALGTKQIGTSSISTVSLGSNATCPADVNIRNGIKVSYEWFCMYATGLRPVILALAWLSAGFLIFGMKLE